MKNITTLRNHLFDQLERLAQANTNEEINQEVSKSAAIINVADTILRSARVEAEVIGSVKVLNSAFIPDVLQEIMTKQVEDKTKPYEFGQK